MTFHQKLIIDYIKRHYEVILQSHWKKDNLTELIISNEKPSYYEKYSKGEFDILIYKIFGPFGTKTFEIIDNWVKQEIEKHYKYIHDYLNDYRVILAIDNWYIVRKDNVHKKLDVKIMDNELKIPEPFYFHVLELIIDKWREEKIIEQTEINMKLGII